jgi:hypothetical protein
MIERANGLEQASNAFFMSDVEHVATGAFRQRGQGAIKPCFAARGDDDLGAVARRRLGGRKADPGAAPRITTLLWFSLMAGSPSTIDGASVVSG